MSLLIEIKDLVFEKQVTFVVLFFMTEFLRF